MNKSEAHEKLVDELLVALSATGICRVWRQPTGAAFRHGKMIRYGKKGSADISGLLVGGRRLEVECKTGKAIQNTDQVNFGDMITRMGGLYVVARDVESVLAIVFKAYRNHMKE